MSGYCKIATFPRVRGPLVVADPADDIGIAVDLPPGRAGRHRIAVGKQGAAGRLITGIEYVFGSRYLGGRGVAPDLRPAHGKGGPGAVLTLPLPVVAALMGESDPIADKPTLRRVDRAIETARPQ